ncbi:MAG TPA: heme-copper oxidase subunit III [Acidimicrobiales bacterium]|nr:heme-copper oxidase subunit III [Acidimicrobiales bacterium]
MAVTQALAADPAITRPARHRPDRPPMLAVGVIIWLGSEVMFFSSLFAAFFTIRAHAAVWPPPGTHLDTVRAGIFTIILVASSFTMQKAVFDQEREDRKSAKLWVWITLVLGTAFVANQFFEWVDLSHNPATNPTHTAYGSLFYIMSGLHGLHVFLGLAAMIFLLARLRGPAGDPGETSVFQGVSYYWHFVDVVWVGLYSCLFLLK